MLKRIRIGDLNPGNECLINGHRFKIMGKVIRDDHVLICCYEDRLNHRREMCYLALDTEVLINDGIKTCEGIKRA
jgi:hypothetical protein